MALKKINAVDLVSTGYFFPELPPVFTTKSFGEAYNTIFSTKELKNLVKKNIKSSECVYYSIPKTAYSRRILGIPNPLHYATLSVILSENSKDIFKKLNSKISCSLPVLDSSTNTFRTLKTFTSFRRHCFLLSEDATFELKVDISRYYSTIYTHIIPWALHGRMQAKKKMYDDFLLGNIIDKSLRSLQSMQTMGIPIGPDSSLIISELIGCRLDDELLKKFPNLKAGRYIDDYYFYFSNRSEAETVLKFLQSLLSEYLLSINEEKTALKEFPFSTDPSWIISLRSLRSTCFNDSKVEGDTESEQEIDIRQFFSASFEWAEKYPKEQVMKFAASTLRTVEISDKNWDYYQAWLIKMGLYDPYTLPEICLIFFKNKNRIQKKSVKLFVHQLLDRHVLKRHSYEVAWTLWLAKIMDIKIKKDLAVKIFDANDVVPTLMGLDLKKQGLIGKTVKTSSLNIELTEASLNDGRWLLVYEATTKGWLKPHAANVNFIKAHPFFSKLEAQKISFYNSDISTLVSRQNDEKEKEAIRIWLDGDDYGV